MNYSKDNIENIQFLSGPFNHRFIDLTGQRFERLIALGSIARQRRQILWLCVCDCGGFTRANAATLRRGESKSCGCLRDEKLSKHRYKHGQTNIPEYGVWGGMRNRCNNPNHPKFAQYGGRGINVCDRWDDFANFLADMGERPSPRHSIERIDNNGDYTPENCKWGTLIEQMNNQQKTLMIDYQDRTQSLSIWCRELNIPRYRTYKRIYIRGWDIERAFTEPQHKNKYV